MGIEIKTKCPKCGMEFHHRFVGNAGICGNSTTITIGPCQACHPEKPEATAPKAGEKIEVRLEDFPPGNYNTRTAIGGRSSDGEVETNNLVNPSSRSRWPQWRYPGEEKWRS